MARSLTNQDISWFLDIHGRGQLDLEPPYQRRSVWSSRDKRFFIDTVLNDYPTPPIFLYKTLNEQGTPTYHVVDGKQRLQTIIDFTKGKVRIPDNFSDVALQKKNWNDLPLDKRELFWNYSLSVEMLPDVSDSFVRNIFDRINRNSRKLTPQEMRHAKYDGWFITTAEAEAERPEWKDFGLATAARLKRMADVQFVSELLGVVIRKKIDGFDQDAIDDLYAEYEDLSENPIFIEDEFLEEIERIKSYISSVLRHKPVVQDFLKVQAHFYSLWGYIHLESDHILPVDEFASRYTAFLQQVSAVLETAEGGQQEAVIEYATNTRGASTDLTPRQKRHSALLKAISRSEL
jgi:hypothetical protein